MLMPPKTIATPEEVVSGLKVTRPQHHRVISREERRSIRPSRAGRIINLYGLYPTLLAVLDKHERVQVPCRDIRRALSRELRG